MTSATVTLDRAFAIGAVDPRLFGSFVEHLGRCVYGGIVEPGHPEADENGFRTDVLALVKELGATIVRYPGGNFVSGYCWEDGVGPVDKRPARIDLAWRSTEPNTFGTDEFMRWCRTAGIEPMFAVNLGTRGPLEAAQLLEYCNHPGGTALSDQRRANGAEKPHDILFWCLGNEMDGPWQTGQKDPTEYGLLARETAKAMRALDGRLQLAACGSSGRDMATFGRWEYEVLDACFEFVDFLSVHLYFRDTTGDLATFLANIDMMDAYIREVTAIADAVAAKRRSAKRIMLSFDEWNVWYKARAPEHQRQPGFPIAPRLLEETYDMQDALAVGGALITLINHADRVKAACLAQLVNVIAPIMCEADGTAWRQSIFFPFADAAKARGTVLRAGVSGPQMDAGDLGSVQALLVAAIEDQERGMLRLLLLNRHLAGPLDIRVALPAQGYHVVAAHVLHHHDKSAVNTAAAPKTIWPHANDNARVDGQTLTTRLPAACWASIELATAAGGRA